MRELYFLGLCLLFISGTSRAQDSLSRYMRGKIISESTEVEGVHIINRNTEKGSVSDIHGNFFITVAAGDTLIFSAVHLKGEQFVLAPADIRSDLLLVRLEPATLLLNEVIVKEYPHINAVALGIIPAGQKRYSPAERKLKAASGANATLGLNTSFSADPLLNLFSGRTAMLKKELEVEKKEQLLEILQEMFDDFYINTKLAVPITYVKGFRIFSIEDRNFVNSLQSKNLTLATFLLGELAVQYKSLLTYEK